MKRVLATAAAVLALATGGAAHADTHIFAGAGGDLPDRVDFSSVINVVGAFNVSDVDITLNGLSHTFWGDLEVYLSHGGQTVMLTNDNGGGLDPNGDFTFDDEAPLGVASLNSAGGSFQPLNLLSAFDGMSAAGDWTLRIIDDAGADAGALRGWTLTLTDTTSTGAIPEPATWAMMILGFFGAGSMVRRRQVAEA